MASTAESNATKPEGRRPNLFLLALGGFIGTLVITVPMHWNNAFFLLSGTVLPVILAVLLSRGSGYRLRFPGLISLTLTLASVFALCWLGRYPSPDRAFADALGTSVPDGVRGLSTIQGWYDGRITVLRFAADPEVIRSLIPPQGEVNPLDPDITSHAWQSAMSLGMIIDPSLRRFPEWKEPHRATWTTSSESGEPKSINMIWDAGSGAAVVCVHED